MAKHVEVDGFTVTEKQADKLEARNLIEPCPHPECEQDYHFCEFVDQNRAIASVSPAWRRAMGPQAG